MPCSLVWPAALLSTRRTLVARCPQRTFEFLGALQGRERLSDRCGGDRRD